MIIPLLYHAVTFLFWECVLKCYKANILCSLYVELMNWLVQLVECNLFVLSWILERQTMACLLSCSRQLMSAAPPMQRQAAILHNATHRQPLGGSYVWFQLDGFSWIYMLRRIAHHHSIQPSLLGARIVSSYLIALLGWRVLSVPRETRRLL